MSNILNVSNLTKIFTKKNIFGSIKSKFTAVDNISFDLKGGEVLGFLGPNGAGKTTTIHMLLDVLTPTSGEINYFGKNFSEYRSQIMQDVTFASTYIRLPSRLTVKENLEIYGKLYSIESKELNHRIEKFLDFFEIRNLINSPCSDLSAGQMTRVILIKAFLPKPKIVLLDEPTASLDPDISLQVRDFIKAQARSEGTSILITSHDMDEVTDICNRVIVLKNGKIIANDKPDNLISNITECKLHIILNSGADDLINLLRSETLNHKIDKNKFTIFVEEQRIPDIIQKMVRSGITFTQISIDKPNLEDYFLSIAKKVS